MALCSAGPVGCLLSITTSQSSQQKTPLAPPLSTPSAGFPSRVVSAQCSRESLALRRQVRARAFPSGGRGCVRGGAEEWRREKALLLAPPLRAGASEGATEGESAAGDADASEVEVEDDSYDPDDVAVSDESVPDDILETLAAAETPQPTSSEPPEFAALSYTAVSPSPSDVSAESWAAADGAPPPPPEEDVRRMDLKLTLMDSLFGLERGIRASSEGRAEIAELVAQLEALNPTPYPAEESTLLAGRWLLAYTSFSELLPLLAASLIPLVKVGDIVQEVDTESMTILNAVTFIGPLTSTTFEASAAFEVRSPKRLQIKFQEGSISPPRVEDLSGSPLPSSVDLFGQTVDLGSFSQALQPLQQAATALSQSLSGLPPLKFQLGSGGAQSWLLTTYLDEDIRISRGDGGGLFVLIKEGSNLK